MSKIQKKSAKDKAFDRERTKLHSIIQKRDEEIQRLSREVAKYKADAESWEKTAKLLEKYIGVPTEQILSDIERNKKITNFLDPTISLIERYLQGQNMKFKFLIKDRSTKTCYFCGTNKSVKYHSKIEQENGEIIDISCCNRCVLVQMNELVEF